MRGRASCCGIEAVFALLMGSPACTRERNDGLYRVITYLVSKMLEELLLAVVASLIFSCIVFYGVRLQGEWVLFWLVYLVTLATGIGVPSLPCDWHK